MIHDPTEASELQAELDRLDTAMDWLDEDEGEEQFPGDRFDCARARFQVQRRAARIVKRLRNLRSH